MISHILVGTDGSRYGDTACAFGMDLAGKLSARLTGVHVLDSRLLEGPLMADISGWIGAQPYGHQLAQFREVLEKKGRAVADAFTERCAESGIEGAGVLRMGHPSRVLLDEEEQADLMVLGQRGLHADLLGDSMGSVVERVVRHSVKPCLVTPESFCDVSKLVAAYDGSDHARHALAQAISLARALDLELILLTVTEQEAAAAAERLGAEALQEAESQGCRAVTLVCEGRRPGQAILEGAAEQGADMIVMGAYGHSRIREMILGSTTHFVITHSDLPVMLVR